MSVNRGVKKEQVGCVLNGISCWPLELSTAVCMEVDATGDVILSELSQSQEDKYYVLSHLCSLDFI